MTKVLEPIKGFIGLTIATPLAVMATASIGAASSIPAGIRGATQSLVGVGLVGTAANLFSFGKKER